MVVDLTEVEKYKFLPGSYKVLDVDGIPFTMTIGENYMLHSYNDQPAVSYADGYTEWYNNNERHRKYGPAIIHPDGTQEYFWKGLLHREDGPAIIRRDGKKKFYFHGKEMGGMDGIRLAKQDKQQTIERQLLAKHGLRYQLERLLPKKNRLLNFVRKEQGHIDPTLVVALVCLPCYGFGDIIFCMKIARYLVEWYNFANIHIVTTQGDKFRTLGFPNIIDLNVIRLDSGDDCANFSEIQLPPGENIDPDVIFITPVYEGMENNYDNVTKLFPNAHPYNTYFMSEYNPATPEMYDFPTGVGVKDDVQLMGLLFTNDPDIGPPLYTDLPYAFSYIADQKHIKGAVGCWTNFVNMIVHKYKEHNNFSIVAPPWIYDWLQHFRAHLDINDNYSILRVISPNEIVEEYIHHPINVRNRGRTFTIDFSVLPVNNRDMKNLIYHSVKDVLLTGDQSVTDMLSCCVQKNLWYQVAPWKVSLVKAMSREMNQPWLANKCGSYIEREIHFDSDYYNFKQLWDFRKLGKPKMDAIMSLISLNKLQPGWAKILWDSIRS